MKIIVALLIAGVAALMGFVGWRGECAGGTIVFDEAGCRQSGALSAAACATVFRDAERVTRAASTVYPNEARCMTDHDRCVRSASTQGYTPVPAGFCVVASGDAVTRQEPVYRRINAAPLGGQR